MEFFLIGLHTLFFTFMLLLQGCELRFRLYYCLLQKASFRTEIALRGFQGLCLRPHNRIDYRCRQRNIVRDGLIEGITAIKFRIDANDVEHGFLVKAE